MNRIRLASVAVLAVLGFATAQTKTQNEPGSSAEKPEHIVALGGSLTEIVYALGAEERLVGVDLTSQYPEQARELPQVGYLRTLSAEGVLSLEPDLILATDEAGPPPVMKQLRDTGVEIVVIPERHSLDGVVEKIKAVAAALGLESKGEKLIAKLEKQRDELAKRLADQPSKSAVFLMAQGPDSLMAAGTDTAADAMLRLAGAENTVSEYTGYKPVSAESLAILDPDVLVVGARTVQSSGGMDALMAMPVLVATPAAQQGRVVVMDDLYLLGFGPRTGSAAMDLAQAIGK